MGYVRAPRNLGTSLQTDASERGWGATLRLEGKEVASCADEWTLKQAKLHITHRKALRSALVLETLIPKVESGSLVTIESDATSTVHAWRKGSKVRGMNTAIRLQAMHAHMRGIQLKSRHIPKSYRPDPRGF